MEMWPGYTGLNCDQETLKCLQSEISVEQVICDNKGYQTKLGKRAEWCKIHFDCIAGKKYTLDNDYYYVVLSCAKIFESFKLLRNFNVLVDAMQINFYLFLVGSFLQSWEAGWFIEVHWAFNTKVMGRYHQTLSRSFCRRKKTSVCNFEIVNLIFNLERMVEEHDPVETGPDLCSRPCLFLICLSGQDVLQRLPWNLLHGFAMQWKSLC